MLAEAWKTLYLFGAVHGIFIFLCILGWLGSVVLSMCFGVCATHSSDGLTTEAETRYAKKLKPWVILAGIITVISTFANIAWPDKNTIVTYYVLKQVDTYNAEHPKSNISTNGILGFADKSVEQISQMLTNIIAASTKLTDLIPVVKEVQKAVEAPVKK
jgi:hypothetical protein